jgi:hypothetical protein
MKQKIYYWVVYTAQNSFIHHGRKEEYDSEVVDSSFSEDVEISAPCFSYTKALKELYANSPQTVIV